jgi:hypothetical protein
MLRGRSTEVFVFQQTKKMMMITNQTLSSSSSSSNNDDTIKQIPLKNCNLSRLQRRYLHVYIVSPSTDTLLEVEYPQSHPGISICHAIWLYLKIDDSWSVRKYQHRFLFFHYKTDFYLAYITEDVLKDNPKNEVEAMLLGAVQRHEKIKNLKRVGTVGGVVGLGAAGMLYRHYKRKKYIIVWKKDEAYDFPIEQLRAALDYARVQFYEDFIHPEDKYIVLVKTTANRLSGAKIDNAKRHYPGGLVVVISFNVNPSQGDNMFLLKETRYIQLWFNEEKVFYLSDVVPKIREQLPLT